ncbi:MAG: CehA/McbA family metallohydrolase [Anaerolineae bacterium]
MGKADLHIHTIHSADGTATVPAVLEHVRRHTDLDLIAITDHDEIRGAREAQELASAYGIEVVPGIEISTAQGHLLALFVEEVVPRGRSLVETVKRVGDLGGLCIAAHPGGAMAVSLSPKAIRRALRDPEVAQVLVGAESYNAGLLHLRTNIGAARLAREQGLAEIGSSDAHMLWPIGTGVTTFEGTTAEDLRRALLERTTGVGYRARPWHFPLSWVGRQILRRFGFASWSPRLPGGPLGLRHRARVEPSW